MRNLGRNAVYVFNLAWERCLKLRRIPKYVLESRREQLDILLIYVNAHKKSRGKTKYHVDHIIPLQGEKVSGLHVASNLQILEKTRNIRKGNYYELPNN